MVGKGRRPCPHGSLLSTARARRFVALPHNLFSLRSRKIKAPQPRLKPFSTLPVFIHKGSVCWVRVKQCVTEFHLTGTVSLAGLRSSQPLPLPPPDAASRAGWARHFSPAQRKTSARSSAERAAIHNRCRRRSRGARSPGRTFRLRVAWPRDRLTVPASPLMAPRLLQVRRIFRPAIMSGRPTA